MQSVSICTSVDVLEYEEHRDEEVSSLLFCQLVQLHDGLLFDEGRDWRGSRGEQTGKLGHLTQRYLILGMASTVQNEYIHLL